MTLNMPQLLNTFPTSAAAGEGFESQYVEKFFLEAEGIVPIGSIVPWLKSFTGVPALSATTLFVECNGQVLNDPASLLDGQTIPDLNGGNRWVRGNATSGGTGGSAGTTQLVIPPGNMIGGGGGWGNWADGNESARFPPYYDVVWIMRVK